MSTTLKIPMDMPLFWKGNYLPEAQNLNVYKISRFKRNYESGDIPLQNMTVKNTGFKQHVALSPGEHSTQALESRPHRPTVHSVPRCAPGLTTRGPACWEDVICSI